MQEESDDQSENITPIKEEFSIEENGIVGEIKSIPVHLLNNE